MSEGKSQSAFLRGLQLTAMDNKARGLLGSCSREEKGAWRRKQVRLLNEARAHRQPRM